MKLSPLTVGAAVFACAGIGVATLRAPGLGRATMPVAKAAVPAVAGKASSLRIAGSPADVAPPSNAAPNEMGRIPVLMYHSVGDRGAYDKHGLNISPETFRKHMQLLHDNGFYPVNMRDVLSPVVNVPRGWTPVVITFDDARASQYRNRGGKLDPNCALGILEAAHAKYGASWPQRATFYLLPASKFNPSPFGEEKTVTAKFKFLADSGYELANHSTSHHALNRMDKAQLEWESRTCRDYVKKRVPAATMDTFACPYGIYPRSEALLDVLMQQGNRAVLMAWGDASYAPLDKRYNLRRIQRIGSEPGVIENWVRALVRARKTPDASLAPFISDGDPQTATIPAAKEKFIDRARLQSVSLSVLPAPKPAPATKKPTGKTKTAKPIKGT